MRMKEAHYSSLAAMRSRSAAGKATRARFDAEAFDVELHGGVPVIVLPGRPGCAIVTGTPNSFGRLPLRILGREHRLPLELAGVSAESIGQHLGTDDRRGDRRRPPQRVRVPDRPRPGQGSVLARQPGLRRRVAAHATADGHPGARRSGSAPDMAWRFSTLARGCRTWIPLRSADGPVGRGRTSSRWLASSKRTFTRPRSSWRAFGSARDSVCCRRCSSSPWPRSERAVGDRVGAASAVPGAARPAAPPASCWCSTSRRS